MDRFNHFFKAVTAIALMIFLSGTAMAQSFQLTSDVLEPAYQGKINWVDLDSDGDLDLLYCGFTEDALGFGTFVYRNDNGAFTKINTNLPNIRNGGFAWGDFDNDNDPDILITGLSESGNIAALYQNNGALNFSLKESFGGLINSSASWFDIDNDTDLDFLFAGTDETVSPAAARIRVYQNIGGGTFQALAGTNLPSCSQCAIEWADANGDGFTDVIFSGFRDTGLGRSTLHLNNGDRTFRTDTGIKLKNVFNGDIKWADFDKDGDPDVVQSGPEQGNAGSLIFTTLFENQNGVWKTRTDIPLQSVGENWAGGTTWADYDNDGSVDLILSGRGGSLIATNYYFKIFRNSGAGTFQETFSLDGVTDSSIDAADYDNDGDIDICFTGNSANGPVTGIYRNSLLTTTKPLNAQPGTPDLLTMKETSLYRKQLKLEWGAGTDTESPADALSYNVYVRSDDKSLVLPGSNVTNGYRRIPVSANGYGKKLFIKDMPEGNLHWAVQTIDGGLRASDFTAEKTFYHINGPQSIKAQIIDPSNIKLFWSDNSLVEDNFVIHKSAGAPNNYSPLVTLPANTSDYTDAGTFTPETIYYYRIFASNASAVSGFDSLYAVIPQSPINLVAKMVSASMISLTWTDRTKYETNYVVERKKSGDANFTVIATLGGGKVSYNDQSLTEGTYYEYRVKAINTFGSSAYTLTASAVTNFKPTSSDVPLEIQEDTELVFDGDMLTPYFSDGNPGDNLTSIRIEGLPEAGFMTFNGVMVTLNQVIPMTSIAQLIYTPDSDYNGEVTILFRVSDGKDFSVNPNTLNLAILAVNDPPSFFFAESVDLEEDFQGSSLHSPFPFAPDNESFETIVYSLEPSSSELVNISFDENTGSIEFTAVMNAEGMASFVLTANDGNAENNIFSHEFVVTVSAVNDAPVLLPITDVSFEVDEEMKVEVPVSDVDNELSSLQVNVTSSNPSLITDANLNVSLVGGKLILSASPNADQTGDAVLTVSVSDGEFSAEGTFVFSVVPVTGIEDIIAGRIEMYPNPAHDRVLIKVKERGILRLQNSLGKEIQSIHVKEEQTIDVSAFSSGVYLLKMVSGNGKVYVGKLVKN